MRAPDGSTRRRPRRSPRRRAAGLAALVVVAALGGIGALIGVGVAVRDERAGGPGRQAASGTGTEGLAAIGNASAGNCLTLFAYQTIRIRVEATADSTESVAAFFPDTTDGVKTIPPGGAATDTLDKGPNHCSFAGPKGQIETLDGPVDVATMEGPTNTYGNYTKIDGTLSGVAFPNRVKFSLKEGATMSSPPLEVIRSSDPETRTAQVVIRVRNRTT